MTNPLTCDQCRMHLPWFLTGHLPSEVERAVAEHVATCSACRDEVAQWRDVARLFREEHEALPPNSNADRGWAALVAHLPPQSLPQHIGPTQGVTYMEFDETQHDLPPTQERRPQRGSRGGRGIPAIALAAVVVLALLSAGIFTLVGGKHRAVSGPAASPTHASAPPDQSALSDGGFIFSSSIVTPDDIWAVGNYFAGGDTSAASSALIVHYQNGKWHTVSSGDFPATSLSEVAMVSATEGWAIGATDIVKGTPVGDAGKPLLLHYLNGQWSPAPLPPFPANGYGLHSIQMFSATAGIITALSQSSDLLILRYDGTGWTATDPQVGEQSGLDTGTPSDVSALSVNDIWVRGDHIVRHFDGTAWKTFYNGDTGAYPIVAIDARTDDDVWAQVTNLAALPSGDVPAPGQQPLAAPATLPTNSLLHYDGTGWHPVALPADLPAQSVLLGFVGRDWLPLELNGTGLNVSSPGYLLHLTGSGWQVTRTPALNENILTVTTVGPDEAWAVCSVDHLGANNHTTTTLQRLHYLNGTWSVS